MSAAADSFRYRVFGSLSGNLCLLFKVSRDSVAAFRHGVAGYFTLFPLFFHLLHHLPHMLDRAVLDGEFDPDGAEKAAAERLGEEARQGRFHLGDFRPIAGRVGGCCHAVIIAKMIQMYSTHFCTIFAFSCPAVIIFRMDEKTPLKPPKPKPPEGAWFPALALSVVVVGFQMLLASPSVGVDWLGTPVCIATMAYACVLGYANQRVYATAALLAAPWLIFVLGTLLETSLDATGLRGFIKVAIMAVPLLLVSTGVRESAFGGAFFTALAVVSIAALTALFVLNPDDTTQMLIKIATRVVLPLPIGIAFGYMLRRNFAKKPDPPIQSPPVEQLLPNQFSLMSIFAAMTAVGAAAGFVVLSLPPQPPQPSLLLLAEAAGALIIGDALGVFVSLACLMRTHREYTMEELRQFKDPEPPLMRCPTCGRESRTKTIFCPHCKTHYPPGARVAEDDEEKAWQP